MSVMPAIRVVRFRCVRVGLDEALRTQLIPDLRARQGLVDVVAGRHGQDELGSRFLASVWESAASLATAVDESTGPLADLSDPSAAADIEEEDLTVQVLYRAEGTEVPAIVRALRGRIRPGELVPYIDEARRGMQADVDAGRGPLSLYLAIRDASSDEFLTVSTWRDWSDIEAATGGDFRRPLATRHPERIVDFDVTHYEAITL